MKRILYLGLLLLAMACPATAAEPHRLFGPKASDFADAELTATAVEKTSTGSTAITACALVGKEEVGFRVVLLPKWETESPAYHPHDIFRGTVVIESLGARTEGFVRALAAAYGVKLKDYSFDRVTLTAVALEGNPNKISTGPLKLKLFFEGNADKEYAEVYLNFFLPNNIVQFHEKDPEYRQAIVSYLSKKSRP